MPPMYFRVLQGKLITDFKSYKMKKTILTNILFMPLTAALLLLSGCEKDLRSSYSDAARVYFFERANDQISSRITSKTYSFLLIPSSKLKDTVYVKVKTMGDTTSYNRYTRGMTIADGTTAKEGTDYDFIPGLIAAGKVEGLLPVVLYRTASLKTEDVTLKLAIAETTDFKPGVTEDKEFLLRWSDKLSKPSTWIDFYFGTYSDAKYRFMIDILGIADYPAQACARCVLNPGEFTAAAFMDMVARLKAELIKYNAAHPQNPLRDANGVLVAFP